MSGLTQPTGEASVNPQPCVTTQPVISFQRAEAELYGAKPPATVATRREKSMSLKPGVCISALNSVLTPMKNIGLLFCRSLTKAGKSRGLTISKPVPPRQANSRQFAVNEKI